MKNSINIIIGIIIGVLLVVFISIFTIQSANKSRGQLQVLGSIPKFDFITQDGEVFNESKLKGKITVLYFFFTRCPSACPIMASELLELYSYYKENDKIQFLSITVDPIHDSLSVLIKYKESVGINSSQWQLLRGDTSSVIEFSERGIRLPAENLPAGHSTKFVLIDQNLQIRGYYSSGEPQSLAALKTAIRELALSQMTRNNQN
ncbi:MAG: SCO family protein [Chloroherpetonaceae bacterium]|nr:SCO family protein [Chloroherpetonaceae bacterium]